MGALKDLLARIGSGETDVESALPEFRRLLVTSDPDRPAGDLTYEQREQRAAEGLPDSTNTFTEVAAAWMTGKLTREQYDVLYDAAVRGVRGDPPAEDDLFDLEIEPPDFP